MWLTRHWQQPGCFFRTAVDALHRLQPSCPGVSQVDGCTTRAITSSIRTWRWTSPTDMSCSPRRGGDDLEHCCQVDMPSSTHVHFHKRPWVCAVVLADKKLTVCLLERSGCPAVVRLPSSTCLPTPLCRAAGTSQGCPATDAGRIADTAILAAVGAALACVAWYYDTLDTLLLLKRLLTLTLQLLLSVLLVVQRRNSRASLRSMTVASSTSIVYLRPVEH